MAYLKSSQITGLSAKDVDVKGFTQAGTLKLGDRAYTEHEVLLADNYNIVGDVTVSDNLILSKLSDDGNAITITGDTTTRTITGSGSIEGATLAQTPNATLTGMTGTLGNSVQDSITRLGTVTSGSFPWSSLTGNGRLIQSQYGYKDTNTGQVVSTSNTNTMTGAPLTVQTSSFSIGATAGVWKLSFSLGVNNEISATNWNMSAKFWVSYNGGSTWSNATPGASGTGNYVIYTDHADEYHIVSGEIWNTGIPANQTNVIFGVAFFSIESDNTRYNHNEAMGASLHAQQYDL